MPALRHEVLPHTGIEPGNFRVYAAAAERLFLPPYHAALEAYGLPVQLSRRLGRSLQGLQSVDHALEALRRLQPRPPGLSAFEQRLLDRARQELEA